MALSYKSVMKSFLTLMFIVAAVSASFPPSGIFGGGCDTFSTDVDAIILLDLDQLQLSTMHEIVFNDLAIPDTSTACGGQLIGAFALTWAQNSLAFYPPTDSAFIGRDPVGTVIEAFNATALYPTLVANPLYSGTKSLVDLVRQRCPELGEPIGYLGNTTWYNGTCLEMTKCTCATSRYIVQGTADPTIVLIGLPPSNSCTTDTFTTQLTLTNTSFWVNFTEAPGTNCPAVPTPSPLPLIVIILIILSSVLGCLFFTSVVWCWCIRHGCPCPFPRPRPPTPCPVPPNPCGCSGGNTCNRCRGIFTDTELGLRPRDRDTSTNQESDEWPNRVWRG